MGNIVCCSRIGRSSARHEEDDVVRAPASSPAQHPHDPYQATSLQNSPIADLPLQGSPFAGLPQRYRSGLVDMWANQRGEAMLMGGRRGVRGDVPIEQVLQDFLMEALYLQEQLDDVPANQIGQAVGSDMQQVRDSGSELRNQIVEDMESGDALDAARLQPLLLDLDHTLASVGARLNGAAGQPSADDYRQEIDGIRRDFNAINSAAIDPSQNLAYSGELVGNPLQPR